MEDKTLLKISLGVGLLGVLVLYFLSSGISLEAVENINTIEEEEEVKVTGVVGKVSEQEKVVFIKIWNEKIEEINVVLFKEGEIDLKEGDYVEITGTVEEYEGEKELIGNEVVKK